MLMVKRNGAAISTVLILVARDFREGTIVYLLERLRQAGISVSLVSLSGRLVKGYHGMEIRPDLSLGQLPLTTDHKLLILPDGQACVAALLADPRVLQLIDDTLLNQGLVAAMPEAELMLEQLGLVTAKTAPNFIWLQGQDLANFSEQLISCLQ
jgi:putative intracellular protease/amidase